MKFKKVLMATFLMSALLILSSCGITTSKYRVTFNYTNSKIESYDELVNKGSLVDEPTTPSWNGHEFGGWYQSLEFGENEKWNFKKDKVTKDMTLYAKWDELNSGKVVITFNYNDPNTDNLEEIININNKISQPSNPTREGYKFDGWFTTSNFDPDSLWIFSAYVVKENITLYAKWLEEDVPPTFEFEVIKTHSEYLSNTDMKFDVYKYETNVEGPTIFIMGGIHGDERAGWNAALRLINYEFTRGTIYILPVANVKAAYNTPQPTRHFGQDLNRQFPGNRYGTDTQILAFYIYNVIKEAKPDLVLDLHESRGSYLEEEGYLGNQILLHHGLYNLYVLEVLDAFNKLDLMKGKLSFRLDGSPPSGSINRTFTENEDIPVFTIETNRGGLSINAETIPLESRIAEQLALVEIILNTFEVIK